MLLAIRGFNYGPDGIRVEAGDKVSEKVLPDDVRERLLSRGVLVPAKRATRPATTRNDVPAPTHTAAASEDATGAQTEDEG